MPGASGTEITVKKVRRIISRYTSDVRGEKTDEEGKKKKVKPEEDEAEEDGAEEDGAEEGGAEESGEDTPKVNDNQDLDDSFIQTEDIENLFNEITTKDLFSP